MNKYSAKKIAVLVVLGVAVFAIASIAFAGNAFAAEPTAQTRDATEISEDSARLNGYLYTNGEDTTYWFEYGTSRGNLNHDTSEKDVSDRDGRVTVWNTIENGLNSDQTYYFRIVAENADGIDQGEIFSFQTDDNGNGNSDNDPIVDTLSASVQSDGDSVILRGRVDPQDDWVQVWFRYGRSSSHLDFTTPMVTYFGSSDQDFSRTVNNLISGETYYYQAAARNGNSTDYGQTRQFTATGDNGDNDQDNFQAPLVSTNSATVTGRNSATVSAQVNPNGNLTAVWFEYGRTASLGFATTRDPAGSGTSYTNYSANLNGLATGSTYYYRAVAQSTSGTTRGQILSFRTQGAPVVPTTPTTPTNPTPTTTPNGTPGCFTVSPAISSPQLAANQDFTYSVTYRNDCGYTLSSGSLQITLPVATDFAATNYPFLSRDGNVITYNLGTIAPNFQAAVTVDGKVRSQATSGDSLIFQANITFKDSRGVSQNASAYLSAMIVEGGSANGTSTLGASAADALNNLFYSGWFWLVLFLVLVALFVFWLATRRRGDEDEDEADDTESVGH